MVIDDTKSAEPHRFRPPQAGQNNTAHAFSSIVIDLTLLDYEAQRDAREAIIVGNDYVAPMPTAFDGNTNPETDPIYRPFAQLKDGGSSIKVGKTIELIDEDFRRLTLLVQHRNTGLVIARGNRFRRNTRFGAHHLQSHRPSLETEQSC